MKRMISLFLVMLMLLAWIPVPATAAVSGISMGADYEEITDSLSNPERGFYHTCKIIGKQEGNMAKNPEDRLVHMRISIGCFSHNYLRYHGQAQENDTVDGWEPISEDFLAALNETMDNIRSNEGAAIIRFAYDDFDGIADLEPSMEGVVAHISQLQGFFVRNADVIAAVESGFLGCWGEQHTSLLVNRENRSESIPILVDALLEAVPEPITVSVRRPVYYCYAADVDLEEIQTHRVDSDHPYYRVGVYNDGYLGSETDLGTYSNRESEIQWLEYQAGHTLYGGEVVADRATDGVVYNSIDYISQEMFRTHTSYLNIEWNDSVIEQWRNTVYTGSDPVYYGLSGFTYVENHLGYRFVLRSSTDWGDRITAVIENVGAGNVVKPKTVTLNLCSETGAVTEIPTAIDVRSWTSRNTAEIVIALPKSLDPGAYTVYLKIADENGNQVRFANDNPFTELGNCIGSITREPEQINSESSIYCWNLYLLNRGSYDSIRPFFEELNITRVYQSLPEIYLGQRETVSMVQRLAADGIETVLLAGDRSWGLAECDLEEVKAYIDAIARYNEGTGAQAPIRKLALDVETYTYSAWKNNRLAYFTAYVEKMREVYEYAHSAGLEIVQVIPVHLDNIDDDLFREFLETCCDEVSLMNYNKATQVTAIEREIELCRELGMKVETVFETMPYSEEYSVTEEITYFYEGFGALQNKRSDILNTYRYAGLSTSYHYFPTMYHVTTGNYLAELYAYTNSGDPTRNELGQTDALDTIVLTGDDGSVIYAGLYNPNLGAEYEETCYLAVGVRPGVTYTVSALSDEYRVTTAEKNFEYASGDLIDYTSIRLERIEVPAVCDHQAQLKNAVEATCTAPGYSGDICCSLCGMLLEAGRETEKLPHEMEAVSQNDGTHSLECADCGFAEGSGNCLDENADSFCDVCAAQVKRETKYLAAASMSSGSSYLILSSGKALSVDLTASALTMTQNGDGFVPDREVQEKLLWQYDNGKLYCEWEGVRCYLGADNGVLCITRDASKAVNWKLSGGQLSTEIAQKTGSKTKTKKYFLGASGSGFVLTNKKCTVSIYTPQE